MYILYPSWKMYKPLPQVLRMTFELSCLWKKSHDYGSKCPQPIIADKSWIVTEAITVACSVGPMVYNSADY